LSLNLKNNNFNQITAIFVIVALMGVSLFSMYQSTMWVSASSNENEHFDTFDTLSWDGTGSQENERYGWNMTYMKDLNGDQYVDLIIGAPWFNDGASHDIGAIYIFYGKAEHTFNNLNPSAANVVITGDVDGDNFGWDVADAGDTNNDGINDLIVGAPGANNNIGRGYLFNGGTLNDGTTTATQAASRILIGQKLGLGEDAEYGSSVSGIGDLNKDGYDEVLVGAPGADKVVITYGYKNKVTLFPDLWDDDITSKGIIRFDKGVNNGAGDLNTWGLDGNDDGWDWIDSFQDNDQLYGHSTPAPYDHAFNYAPWEKDGVEADGLTWGNRSSLEVAIGRSHTQLNPYGSDSQNLDPTASAAWGIEFKISQSMFDYISSNSTIELSFHYGALDSNIIYNNSNISRRHITGICSRIWNSTGVEYLGNEVVGDKTYVFYKQDNWNVPPWGPIYGNFNSDITQYIDQPGSYYWDFGGYFSRGWTYRNDDGMMAFFDNITMKITNERNVIIEGAQASGFGSDIAEVGDITGDGYPDAVIGAPNYQEGYVMLLEGKKRFNNLEQSTMATTVLTGKALGDNFGYSVACAGDVDNDGLSDVVIGAPGGNYAYLYYGSTLTKPQLVPDLSEKNVEKNTPMIEFDSGLKSSGNTPGISAPDDGWDVWNGVYGYQSGGTPGSSVKYNHADGIDSAQVAIDDRIMIAIGGTYGGGSSVGAKPDSGAYGVKFSVSQEMINAIEAGGEAILSFDWEFDNKGLDQDDTIWIKTYIRSETDNYDMGWNLDEYAFDNANKDDSNEVYWAEAPASKKSTFIQSCSEIFSEAGSYYFDVGAKVRNYWWESPTWEDGLFYFDNIYLRINPVPDVVFKGPEDSGFGHSLGYSDKMDIDDKGDIIIGAPNFDSHNGNDSGAVFGFLMGTNNKRVKDTDMADFAAYGENQGDHFGWCILGTESLDDDEFTEIITSAINYDSTSPNVGKIYLLSITMGPRLRLLHPQSGDYIFGEVVVNATVSDPDRNIDNTMGVYFYYSTDFIDWEVIGFDLTESELDKSYECTWDTTDLPDGSNYYIKGWVQDLDKNNAENYSEAFTVDNQHAPEIKLQSPMILSLIILEAELIQLQVSSSFYLRIRLCGNNWESNIPVKMMFIRYH
jgi:hypothetical protein